MPSHETALALIEAYGLWILTPVAILEGPIVTVIAAYLAQQGYMNGVAVYLVCLAGDLLGDVLFYAIGRFGASRLPERLTQWLGLSKAREVALIAHFATKGGRTLLLGKWTHSAGLPIIVAAGMAKMNFAAYLWFNLLGTLPKTFLFVVLGYFLGAAYPVVDTYIYRTSLVLLMFALLAAGLFLSHARKTQ